MKKSIQTIMTAAVFAAALGAGAGDTLSAQSVQHADAADDLNAVTMIPQPVYGPPEWMTDEWENPDPLIEDGVAPVYTESTGLTLEGTSVIPQTTVSQTRDLALCGTTVIPITSTLALAGTSVVPQEHSTTSTTTTTFLTMEGTTPIQTEPELVTPGEAPLYDAQGDLDHNGSIDARDLSLLKQYILTNNTGKDFYGSDMNLDGKIDKEDVKALLRMLTGKPEDEDDPAVTTSVIPGDVTSTTTTRTTICTLYGPPPAWN